MKKMLEKKLAELSGQNGSQTKDKVIVREPAAIEVAKRHSKKDIILWLLALTMLILATMVEQYLPAYWQVASNVWVRIAIIVGLVVVSLVMLALTNQGSAFKTLLSDSRIELRRITWPSKAETLQYTWQVLVMTGILTMIIWGMDMMFNTFIKWVIGQ